MAKSFIPEKKKKPEITFEKFERETTLSPKKGARKVAKKKPETKSLVKTPEFSPEQRKALIMADWEKPPTFGLMLKKFKITNEQLVESMKKLVGPRDFRRWRRKAEGHGHVKAKTIED